MKTRVRYVESRDGISLAWTMGGGRGPLLVRASNWLTHLEYDLESPVWRHWTRFLSSHFRYLRYDERGCGMSDWRVGDLSCDRWIEDLEDVIGAAGIDEPMLLFGVSQGAAVAVDYAARYPDRVSGLILYGGYAVGARGRDDTEFARAYSAMQELVRIGWNKDNPIFRQLFTSRFIPEGTDEQIGWFNDLCRRTTTPENAYRLLDARADVDVRHQLSKVCAPTLVLHADGDEVIPVGEGKRLAREIPGAEFVLLSSNNHVLLEHEPAWRDFTSAVLEFIGATDADADAALSMLTPREREVFGLLCRGKSNANIAAELGISEKTVRNHLSVIYGKLGVRSRAEALVLSREADLLH